MVFSNSNADGGAGSSQRQFFASSEVTPTVTVMPKFQGTMQLGRLLL